MRRTKIVCTIGPASDEPRHLRGLIEHGMDVARLNLSHGTHGEHAKRAEYIRKAAMELDKVVGLLFDVRGPKIRVGMLERGKELLKEGEKVVLDAEAKAGGGGVIPIDYPRLPRLVKPGEPIYLSDGMLELRVEAVEGPKIRCTVVIGGELGSRKGVNVRGVDLHAPAISAADRKDVEFAVKQGAEFIAQSFVRSAGDVREMKKLLGRLGSGAWVIAKIENAAAYENIDAIIAEADGVMVARGDLGVQLPTEDLPIMQKTMVAKCNRAAKPVIIATQMLESMTHAPQPTRAEVSDVANAVVDGADAVMLSGETATGKHPVRVVEYMDKIVRKAEATLAQFDKMVEAEGRGPKLDQAQSVAKSACHAARDLRANAIVPYTMHGNTARYVSMHRPFTPIIGATSYPDAMRRLVLLWGVQPVLIPRPKDAEELFNNAARVAREKNLADKGDVIVVTAGIPFDVQGNTNLIKVHTV